MRIQRKIATGRGKMNGKGQAEGKPRERAWARGVTNREETSVLWV